MKWWSNISPNKMSKGVRFLTILVLIILAILFAIGGKFLFTLPLTLSFNHSRNTNPSSLSVPEAYKILNLDINHKPTKELVNKSYIKIQKKIHPDISPETGRLSTLVNEAKEIVLKDIS